MVTDSSATSPFPLPFSMLILKSDCLSFRVGGQVAWRWCSHSDPNCALVGFKLSSCGMQSHPWQLNL